MLLRPIVAAVLLSCVLGCQESESSAQLETEADGDSDAGGGPLMHGAVNGQCVEAGQRFLDVFTCEGVMGPSGTEPPVSAAAVDHDPDTLADPDYPWVVEQIEACSCTCCHLENGAGSYRWSGTFAPAWSDSAEDSVLDSLGFRGGPSLAAQANHGFTRDESGLPTTDPVRLQGFFQRELDRRAAQ